MTLSYWLRLACVIAGSIGLLAVLVELGLWVTAPVTLWLARGLAVRWQERVLFGIQVLPAAVAVMIAGCFCVPHYVLHETNFEPEAVGWVGLLLAAWMVAWLALRLVAGLRMLVRTVVFARACRRQGAGSTGRVVAIGGPEQRVGLVGLLRPLVFISRSLMGAGGLQAEALEVVLQHERAHATQRDNWKLLVLQCVPRLNLRVAGGKSWLQRWQSAAEWAADDDAVGGSRERAIVLAETLVALARSGGESRAALACTYFVSAESELAVRVERLLRPVEVVGVSMPKVILATGGAALSGAMVLANVAGLLGEIPERLLHLG